jgi:hypothetical protein
MERVSFFKMLFAVIGCCGKYADDGPKEIGKNLITILVNN